MQDEKVFLAYCSVSKFARLFRTFIEGGGNNITNPKEKLIVGLFTMGIIDAASQTMDLNDKQFLTLVESIFTNMDYSYDDDYKKRIIIFHQSLKLDDIKYSVITAGMSAYNKFKSKNFDATTACFMTVNDLIADKDFPTSIDLK